MSSPSFEFFLGQYFNLTQTQMFTDQRILKKISIEKLELIINKTDRNEKHIPFTAISKVYISFEKVSVRTKKHFLFISFMTGLVIIPVFPDFLIFLVMTGLCMACYLSMHLFKFCTLNIELTHAKSSIRFIFYGDKSELVHSIQEIRRSVQLTKL